MFRGGCRAGSLNIKGLLEGVRFKRSIGVPYMGFRV